MMMKDPTRALRERTQATRRAERGPRVAYRSSFLTPTAGSNQLTYLEDAVMVIDEEGRIESLSEVPPASGRSSYPGTAGFEGLTHELGRSLIVPAFVDAHVHFPQTRLIGSATGPLLEWLEQTVFPEEARFKDPEYAREVATEFVDHAVAAGTGTLGVFSSSDANATGILFDVLREHGARALVGLTWMDSRCPSDLRVSPDDAVKASIDLCDRFHGHDDGRLEFAITPRFALSSSKELLEKAAALAKERNLAIQTHISENPREGVETLAAFPWAKDYLDVYDALGLVGEKTILAHAIHLSDSEWDRVAQRRAAIAHCPDSNFFLGSGRFHVRKALDRGIKLAMGSDVGAGRSFDMRRAISHGYDNALTIGEPLSLDTLFRASTLGGAEALGFGQRTGSLEVGKDADFAVIGIPGYLNEKKGLGGLGIDHALRVVSFGSDYAKIERTYVRGRLIYRGV